MIDFLTCEDLDVECYHGNKYNLDTFLWSDARIDKHTFETDPQYKDLTLKDYMKKHY